MKQAPRNFNDRLDGPLKQWAVGRSGMGRILWMALCFTMGCVSLSAQYTTTNPSCGKYSVYSWGDGTYSCERYATFPWFAAGQGWQSQVSMFVSPLISNGSARGAITRVQLGDYASDAYVLGGTYGAYGALYYQDTPLLSSNSARFDLKDSLTCSPYPSNCFLDGALGVGPLFVLIDAPDVQTLESAYSQLTYLLTQGGVQTRQVSVPPVYQDAASPNWAANFSETPVDQTAGVNRNTMSFAVTNMSPTAQTVTLYLYDQNGNLIAQKNTPPLGAAVVDLVGITAGSGPTYPGGVYAATFADFFGLNSSVLSGTAAATEGRTGSIDGTVVFRSSAGQAIAPLVLRTVGASVTLIQQVPVP